MVASITPNMAAAQESSGLYLGVPIKMDRHWIDCKCSIKVEYISLENKGEVTIFLNMLFLTTSFNPGYGNEESDPLRKATVTLPLENKRKKEKGTSSLGL